MTNKRNAMKVLFPNVVGVAIGGLVLLWGFHLARAEAAQGYENMFGSFSGPVLVAGEVIIAASLVAGIYVWHKYLKKQG